jgi:hypothetical protein
MAPDEPYDGDEQLVTIAPVPPTLPEPEHRWLGPLVIIGLPVLLGIVVFLFVVLW